MSLFKSLPAAMAIAAFTNSFIDAAQAQAAMQPPITVTATRTPLTVDNTLASVRVLTREDIETTGSLDLVELLRREPGIDVVRGGGLGQQTSIFLRGTNSNHVLVLIDGMRMASANTGSYAWENLPLGQIERIEIVRGPRAALYGSDAIGGVIQIFTRRGHGIDGVLKAGNHDTRGAEAGIGLRAESHGFGVRAGYTDSGGVNAQNPRGPAFDPDDDGLLARSVLANGAFALGGQQFELHGLAMDNDMEFDQGESAVRQHALSLSMAGELSPRWSHRLNIGGSRERLNTPVFFTRFDSRREQLDWQHEVSLPDSGLAVFGAGYLHENGASVNTFDQQTVYAASRHNWAAFADWRGGSGRYDFELAGRYDDNSAFGGESTLQAAWGYQVGTTARIFASLGEGFRAPNLNELFSPGFGGLFAGNPELKPEHSRSMELGLDFTLGASRFGVRAFRTSVEDLIDFAGERFTASNVERARIDGMEGTWNWAAGDWTLDAGITWQDAQDRAAGLPLLRRPARKAGMRVQRLFGNRWRMGVEGFASSSRQDLGTPLPGYGLVAANASYRLSKLISIEARIDNLFDRNYELASGYNTPGQTVLLTLRYANP